MKPEVVILAAGKGTRMRSTLPKVLHTLAGRPLLEHVIATARSLQPARIHVLYGHGGDSVPDAMAGTDLNWIEQAAQNGTGHAVSLALPHVEPDAVVLVMYGDVPLIRKETLTRLLNSLDGAALTLLTAELQNPHGLGRILRDERGGITAIREEQDASEAEKAIREINTGFLAAPAADLQRWLEQVHNQNAQGEYYLTDIVAIAVRESLSVQGVQAADADEILGVNSKMELARLERVFQRGQAAALMADGVTIRDPARIDVRGSLSAGSDCEIDVNVVFEGEVILGNGVKIAQNCTIIDSIIGDGVEIFANSLIEKSCIAAGCQVGPYARFRPQVELAAGVKVGNFVEVKNSSIGPGSKVNHLSYVGDSELGSGVNVGAGTITCNYDGANKHKTTIGDGAFIGSNTALVAPVDVGANAVIGAGSAISSNAPADQLTLARAKQRSIRGWRRPVKQKN